MSRPRQAQQGGAISVLLTFEDIPLRNRDPIHSACVYRKITSVNLGYSLLVVVL